MLQILGSHLNQYLILKLAAYSLLDPGAFVVVPVDRKKKHFENSESDRWWSIRFLATFLRFLSTI